MMMETYTKMTAPHGETESFEILHHDLLLTSLRRGAGGVLRTVVLCRHDSLCGSGSRLRGGRRRLGRRGLVRRRRRASRTLSLAARAVLLRTCHCDDRSVRC